MGQTLTSYFTQDQNVFLSLLHTTSLGFFPNWYLTGGTALAACYFNHRLSEDVDLFTRFPFRQESIVAMMATIAQRIRATLTYRIVDTSLRYELTLHNRHLKVDFVHYEFDQLKKPNMLEAIPVDSIEDIATNKLLTISQRVASKDYVDLYFILKKYTLWDLRLGVEHKFNMEIDSLYLASLLKRADSLTDMPVMKKKLSLETLKKFFLEEARRLALPMTKP